MPRITARGTVRTGRPNAACSSLDASNVAEGQARRGTGEFVQFISHPEGSVAEIETQLRLCLALKFVDESQTVDAFSLMEELRKMLNALRRKLVACHSSPLTRH